MFENAILYGTLRTEEEEAEAVTQTFESTQIHFIKLIVCAGRKPGN